jgi:hypothetical protein
MESVVRCGLLCIRNEANEWLLPDGRDSPLPPDGYVVSFMYFHERGLVAPSHCFLLGLLHYYKIELQHLKPNGIQHITAFIALYEGYLGIEPYFNLWRHFSVDLQKRRGHGWAEVTMPMGCVNIHLRNNWSRDYMAVKLSTSNKG